MKNDYNKQLEIGKRIEKEHSDTIKKIIADVKAGKVKPFEEYFKDIAKDHLKELKDYYTRLIKMEKEGKKTEITENKQPKIFSQTIYRTPTKEELIDINNYDLTADEIVNGFNYTIVGRGMQSEKNKKMIYYSVQLLLNMYPNNKEYQLALNKVRTNLNENIDLPIEKGDVILTGKFRNKKVVVKSIGTDEHGSPTVNGKSILNVRIEKLMKDKKKLKENIDSKQFIKQRLREELQNKFNIKVKDDEAGFIQLRPIPKLGKDAVEIINIKIDTKDFQGIKVAIDAVHGIFKQSSDINKIFICPREESKDFWNHVGFNRLNDDYMFIERGH